MKTLEESLPGASKIIDDNFWDLFGFFVGDRVQVIGDIEKQGSVGTIKEITKEYTLVQIDDAEYKIKEENLKKVEKELQLFNFLHRYEGEKVYHVMYGPVTFLEFKDNKIMIKLEDGTITAVRSNGKSSDKGEVVLFPSKELFHRYPFSPYSAWETWKMSKKPIVEAEVSITIGTERSKALIFDWNRFFRFNTKEDLENMINSLTTSLHDLYIEAHRNNSSADSSDL